MTNLEWALKYLQAGLPIFPIRCYRLAGKEKDEKKPLIDSWTPFQTRLPTREEVEKWWTRWPEAGIGMATGRLPGWTVIDVDTEKDDFGLATLPIPSVKTPSGGQHYYFEYTDKLGTCSGFVPKHDIRSDRGFIVLPPTVQSNGKKYEWTIDMESGLKVKVSESLLEAYAKRKKEKEASGGKAAFNFINPAREGTRNDSATSIAGNYLRRYPPKDWETFAWNGLLNWNEHQAKPPLSITELRSVFESIAGTEMKNRKAVERGRRPYSDLGSAPSIRYLDDRFIIEHETEHGTAVFEYSEIEQSKNRTIESIVSVSLSVPGLTPRPFEARLNILSLSSCEGFARQLTKSFGKDVPWDLLLSTSNRAMREWYANRDTSLWLSEAPTTEDTQYLLEPFVLAGSPNLLFGMGSSGKTYLSLGIAASLATGKAFLGKMPTTAGVKTLFIDYEAESSALARRIKKMAQATEMASLHFEASEVLSHLRYFNPGGTPLADCIPAVKKLIASHKVGLVIIDSAALASGGEPEKAESAVRYFNALASLGPVATLTIAHETKAEQKHYPFGSIFYYNSPRNIWNARAESESGEQTTQISLAHRKSNEDKKHAPVPVQMFFGDGFVDIRLGSSDIVEAEMGQASRILRTMPEGKPVESTRLYSDMPDISKAAIRNVLVRLEKRGKVTRLDDGLWLKKELYTPRNTPPVTPPSDSNENSIPF